MSMRVFLAVVLAALLFGVTSPLLAEEEDVSIFSTFGPENAPIDLGSTSSPPYEIGDPSSNSSVDIQWAMPFETTSFYQLTRIKMALVQLDQENWNVGYVFIVRNDSSAAPADTPIADFGNPDLVVFAGAVYDLPTCGVGESTCIPLAPAPETYFQVTLPTGENSVFLMPGKYWLVFAGYEHPSSTYWYRGGSAAAFSGPAWRNVDQGPYDQDAVWQHQSDTPGAFQIFAKSVPCAPPSAQVSGSCDQNPPTYSNCWWNIFNQGTGIPDHNLGSNSGFPLQIDLWRGFGPPDYPPKTLIPELGSLPLVSKGVAHFGGPSPYLSRPMHNDVIDVITGQPLIQAVDFELPFGGAVFRHVRTYSENQTEMPLAGGFGQTGRAPAAGARWDWNGMSWMMGENPILLIDASYHHMHGDPIIYPDKKRCYLIPDSHHSIPFLHDEFTDQYVAPSWFDAQLQPSTSVDGDGRPTHFHCWLNRKSIKYTFEAHYEDVWKRDFNGVNAHEPPQIIANYPQEPVNNGGLGIPYYGLVTQIEDAYGNRIEYDYCTFMQTEIGESDIPAGPGCKKCYQNCNEKGQIRAIRLVSNNETVWTLVYTHRAFPVNTEPVAIMPIDTPIGATTILRELRDAYQQHQLHSIHVYAGEIDANNGGPIPDCLTIPSERFCRTTTQSIDEIDNIDHDWVVEHPNWVMASKYLYSESGFVTDASAPPAFPAEFEHLSRLDMCHNANLFGDASSTYIDTFGDRYRVGQRLLKATVLKKNENGSIDKMYSLYRDGYSTTSGLPDMNDRATLKFIYEPDTVARILDARRIELQSSQGDISPNFLFDRSTSDVSGWSAGAPTSAIVKVRRPGTDEIEESSFSALADIEMTHYGEPNVDQGSVELRTELIDDWIQSDSNLTVLNNRDRRQRFVDRRAGQKRQGEFRFHYLVQYPPTGSDGSTDPLTSASAMIHQRFPYRFENPRSVDGHLYQAPLNKSFFITVIDELVAEGGAYDPISRDGVRTRRVVEMNPAGFVLRDRTWSFETDGGGQVVSQEGLSETYKRDCMGRLIQKRSLGWGAAELASQAETEGLIEVFQYEDDYCSWDDEDDGCDCAGYANVLSSDPATAGLFNARPGELIATGVKKGTTGDFMYLSRFERNAVGHPELITKQVTFPVITTNPEDASGAVTTTAYVLVQDPNDEHLTRVQEKTIIGPPAPQTLGGDPAYPVERFHYDASGNMDWHGSGLLAGNTPSATPLLFTMEFTERNDLGQTTRAIIDFDGSGATPPTGWARTGYGTALNLTTNFEYEVPHGLKRIQYPNLRETRVANLPYPDGSKQITFTDLIPDDDTFKALSPAKIRIMRGKTLVSEETARVIAFDDAFEGDEEAFQSISITTPAYDEHGRIVGMNASGADQASVTAGISYDGFGNIGRQQDPDGTITRNVYDERGRLARVYRGTNDQHEYWGTARLCVGNENPNETGCITDWQQFTDNLVLFEKRYYGSGINDAGELVTTRHYRDQPNNQYHYVPLEGQPGPGPNDEDDIGWTTEYEYDWRMRPVISTERDHAGNALSHSLTWFDNLDRPRFSAEYGNQIPSSPNPLSVIDQSDFPTAQAILAASPAPTSLTENIYNARGQVEEVRRYNVSVGNGTDYTSTLTYYDNMGRPVEVHSPNSPIRKNEYDAKGRLIATRSLAGDVEMTRTETLYDNDDRAIQSTTYQRIHSSTSGPLTDSNSIRSYTNSWYDITGRVIATANFGTNNDTDDFYVSGEPPVHGAAPVTVDADGRVTACMHTALGTTALPVLITCYTYDSAGRQTKVWHPNGTTTETVYDGLGRTLATIENSSSNDADLIQRTNYEYDTSGRVKKMTAVVPGAVNQQTEFIYDATVVDSAGGAISGNNAWIGEVRFPDAVTGEPSTTDILTFTYYSNGSVATRTDARGIIFRHEYDELNRRIETEIDDSAWYPPPGANQTSIYPPNRVRRIMYGYDDKNRLELITTYRVHHGVEVLFCQNKYQYDSAGRLYREWQAHETAVAASTPFVQYNWESSSYLTDPNNSGSGHNFERLSGIVYPPQVGQSTGRTISFIYGESLDDIDSRLSRITAVADSRFPNSALVDQYQYCGIAQRIKSVFGTLTQSYEGGGGYSGLDRFGRVRDLNYQKSNNDPMLRYQYGYDEAGNRTYSRVTQQPTVAGGQTINHDNDRSYLYGYDELNRLISSSLGQLAGDNKSIVAAGSGAPVPLDSTWYLDNLGNWAGDGSAPGFSQTGDFYGTGSPVTMTTTHAVDRSNRISAITEQFGSYSPNTTTVIHDIAGNLVSDGLYFYQYDAWNRLVQVSELRALTFDGDGRPESSDAGDVVARYAYDGLGRLIRKQSAVQKGGTYIQSKDFYYDGVRRIQDVIFRPPVQSGLFEPEYGNDEGVINPGGPILPQIIYGEDPGSVSDLNAVVWTDREYVYDPSGDVDAFICQIDWQNRVMYMLQDGNLNVVGLTAGPSTANPTLYPWPSVGTLLEQYVYEPYGKVVKSDNFNHGHPVNRVGHQGLFFERYDAEFGHHTLAENALGLYYNRNRFYHPGLGRFTTRDPNETGMPILAALAMNGTSIDVFFGGFNGQRMYTDGLNLFQYESSNPMNRLDPAGLFSLVDVTATSGFQNDRNAESADAGMTLVQLVGAIIGSQTFKHSMMAAMAASSGPQFDVLLTAVQRIQSVQTAMLAKGVIKGGAGLLLHGFGKFAKGVVKMRGQLHHVISKRVHRALEKHPILKGKYSYRDSKLTTRADEAYHHRGYQTWHRNLDFEMEQWLAKNPNASQMDFENFINVRYAKPDLAERFPLGVAHESVWKELLGR